MKGNAGTRDGGTLVTRLWESGPVPLPVSEDRGATAGNLHTWLNRGDAPCLLLFVVVAGKRRR